MFAIYKPKLNPSQSYFNLACFNFILSAYFLLVFWDLIYGRGLFSTGEEANLSLLQAWREGGSLPWSFGQGCVHRFLLAWVSKTCHANLLGLHTVILLCLFLEAFGLALLAVNFFSDEAAVWAVGISFFCAFTMVRGRSLFSYAVLPVEILTGVLAVRFSNLLPVSFLMGLACSLLLLDYEAWVCSLPVLGFLWWKQQRSKKILWNGLAFLSGAMFGLGAVVFLSWENLADFFLIRSAGAIPGGVTEACKQFLVNLKLFFLGGLKVIPYLGVPGHPQFPPWGLPGLLLGTYFMWRQKSHRWILGWACAGLLPLLGRTPLLEPNRAIAAWPALCLVAGYGTSLLVKIFKNTFWRLFLSALILVLALTWEGMVYFQSAGQSGDFYEMAKCEWQAARFMRQACHEKPRRILSDLDWQPKAFFRFLVGEVPAPGALAPPLALIPWEFLPAFSKNTQEWNIVFNEKHQAVLFLLSPDERWATRLTQIQNSLQQCWKKTALLAPSARRTALLALAHSRESKDPWVRTCLWQAAIDLSIMTGRSNPEEFHEAIQSGLLSAGLLWNAGFRLAPTQPKFSRWLLDQASHQDPRYIISPSILQQLDAFESASNSF